MSYADFDRGIPSARLEKQRQEAAAAARKNDMCSRWKESERILTILRTIPSLPAECTPECMESWFADAKKYHSPLNNEKITADGRITNRIDSPSEWFNSRFPRQINIFGQAFLEEIIDGRVSRPVLPNLDFFGAILGGEKGLGHQVVYCPWEKQWYFYDPVGKAFHLTTTAKLQVLASNYLVKCSESFNSLVTVLPILDEFRRPSVLQAITNKAKAILETDRTFFEGPQGKVRQIEGFLLDPASEPPHRLFVKKAVVSRPGATIAISEVHARYVAFCRNEHLPTMAPAEAKKSIAEVIEEIHGLGLRHDITDEYGKHHHGWVGLSFLTM